MPAGITAQSPLESCNRGAGVRVPAGEDHRAMKALRPVEMFDALLFHRNHAAVKTCRHVHPTAARATNRLVKLAGDAVRAGSGGGLILRRQKQARHRHGHRGAGAQAQLDSIGRVQRPAVDLKGLLGRRRVQALPAQNPMGCTPPSRGLGRLAPGL